MKYLQVPHSMAGTKINLIDKRGRVYGFKQLIAFELLTKNEATKLGIADKLSEVDFPRYSIFKFSGFRLSTFDSNRNKARSDFMLKRTLLEDDKC